MPYGAVLQALRGLVKQLLGEPEARLAVWRREFASAVGSNGRVLTDLVPELEEVVGPQPSIPALPPREAHARFQRVFADFLRAAATAEHPLALFVDDLQWTDPSTPELLLHLLVDEGLEHVLFIGSYRDNEVLAGHVLRAVMAELQAKRPDAIQEIRLAPLAEADVNCIVADTLHRAADSCRSVSALIAQKTAGNPFFVKELLALLGHDGAFYFDSAAGRWNWDEERIARAGLSDNVIELMVRRLERLPSETSEVLRLAACLGNSFDLHTLARVAGKPAGDVATALWQAVRERLLVPVGSAYRLFMTAERTTTRDSARSGFGTSSSTIGCSRPRIRSSAKRSGLGSTSPSGACSSRAAAPATRTCSTPPTTSTSAGRSWSSRRSAASSRA